MSIRKQCKICGEEFFVPPKRDKTAKYCSKKCLYKRDIPKMEKSPLWKGGRNILQSGYVRVNTENGWQYEHRIVAEKKLGRPLKKNEAIHHIDGNRQNNHPDNLVVMIRNKHDSFETKRRIKAGTFGLEKYKLSEEYLRKNYIGKNISYRKLAEIIGCSRMTILRRLEKYGIKKNRRSHNF